MKAKDKAEELIRKFTFLTYPESDAKFYNPIQCALICVDELIKYTHSDFRGNSPLDKEYWQQVKQEILNRQ